MTRVHFRVGVLALVPALALVTPLSPVDSLAAQEDCDCSRSFPFITSTGEGPFGFWMGRSARIGVAFGADDQDGFLDVGAVISDVVEDSPAEEAGLLAGDVVVSVDGHDLMEPLDRGMERRLSEDSSAPVQRLLALARNWDAGEPVELEVIRDGDRRQITVIPEEYDMDFEPLRLRMDDVGESLRELGPRLQRQMNGLGNAPRVQVWRGGGDGFEFAFGNHALRGIELTELNPRLGSYFGVESGVLVTEVGEESMLGLEPGDVILRIGDRVVEEPRDVSRILRSYDSDEEVRFEVQRDGSARTVTGSLP